MTTPDEDRIAGGFTEEVAGVQLIAAWSGSNGGMSSFITALDSTGRLWVQHTEDGFWLPYRQPGRVRSDGCFYRRPSGG